ncbi:MAG: hypothetical protein AABY22_16300, partial [Nanoarchaeota archaeon]
FTGQDLWFETDTTADKMKKYTNYFQRLMLPNIAPLPIPFTTEGEPQYGNVAFQKIIEAIKGVPETRGTTTPRDLSKTIFEELSSVKFEPFGEEEFQRVLNIDERVISNEINDRMYRIIFNKKLTPEQRTEELKKIVEKWKEFLEKFRIRRQGPINFRSVPSPLFNQLLQEQVEELGGEEENE